MILEQWKNISNAHCKPARYEYNFSIPMELQLESTTIGSTLKKSHAVDSRHSRFRHQTTKIRPVENMLSKSIVNAEILRTFD